MKISAKTLVYIGMAAIVACGAAPAAAPARPEPDWTVELAPFARLSKEIPAFGKILNNQMLPLLIVTSSQQYFTRKFGRFRTASPIRFVAYRVPDGTEIALVYPSVNRTAKMILENPGAEKTASGNVCLKPGELYAGFSQDNSTYCSFATSERLASSAIHANVPPCPEDAVAKFSWRNGSLTLRFDGEGLCAESEGPDPRPPFSRDIPWLSAIIGDGSMKKRRIDFENLKQAVLALAKQTINIGTAEQ